MLARISLVLAALACQPSIREGEAVAKFEPCRLEPSGLGASCTTHRVYENRAARAGREIDLRIAIVPALAERPRPDPLFILVGGPGQAATEAGAHVAETLREVRRWRDIVLVDQRGTGSSRPLDCDDGDEPLSRRFAPAPDLAKTRSCLTSLDADTKAYVTPVAMDDLEEVRELLGYERINLWGGSYGTRAALVYYRQYPARVRSLVLDGAAPPSLELQLSIPRQAQRALDMVFASCEKDPDCHAAFPHARSELSRLLAALEVEPRSLRVEHPRTHEELTLRLTRGGLAMAVLQALYAPDLSRLLPLAVHRAERGDYSALVAMASAFSDALDVASGMFLSVVCAEDILRISAEEITEMTSGTFLGPEWLQHMQLECNEWASAELPEAYFAPVRGDAPSLILSGEKDPVTPPAWGEQVSRDLPRSRHLVVAGAAHGVSALGCVPELIAEFIESAEPEKLDGRCLERSAQPAFFTSLAGPGP